MNDSKISSILYGSIVVASLICAIANINQAIPFLLGALIGSIAGYFNEKAMQWDRYGEEWDFEFSKLDGWGVLVGIGLSAGTYHLTLWIIASIS